MLFLVWALLGLGLDFDFDWGRGDAQLKIEFSPSKPLTLKFWSAPLMSIN